MPEDFNGLYPQKIMKKSEWTSPILVNDGRQIHPEIIARLGKKRKQRLFKEISKGSVDESLQKILAPAIQQLSEDLKPYNYEPVPVLDRNVDYGLSAEDFSSFSVISNNVLDIETENTDWEQLRDFKIDKPSKLALKRYRTFWHSNYLGKNLAYVEDDLGVRLEDLQGACRKHGFNLMQTSAHAVIKDSSVYSAALAAFAGIVLTGVATPVQALVPGLCIAVSGVSISIAKTLDDKEQFLRQSEILYLHMLREEF